MSHLQVPSSHDHSPQERTAPSLRPTMHSSSMNTDGGADCPGMSVPLGAGPQSHSDRGYGSFPVPSPSLSNIPGMDDSRHQNSTQHGNPKPMLEERREVVRQQQLAVVGSVESVQEAVGRHALSSDDIKLRRDILDAKTASGIFMWKIPDIRKCFRDAMERHTLSVYSPPFYSRPHGYRMCIRVYLNGDGSGSGTHLSVFFVLMQSKHDSSLRWPFTQPVTLTLVNQRFASKNVSRTFFPESQRDHDPFQRPQSEMKKPCGFHRFMLHSALRDVSFTRDGTLSILCGVGISSLLI